MKEEIHDQLYFVFTKDSDGELAEFVGPVLEYECAKAKEIFNTRGEVEVVGEGLFKSLYFEYYRENFISHWESFVGVKLAQIRVQFEFDVADIKIGRESYEDLIINIRNFGRILELDKKIVMDIHEDSNPQLVAVIVNQITKYCDNIMDSVIANSYDNEKNYKISKA